MQLITAIGSKQERPHCVASGWPAAPPPGRFDTGWALLEVKPPPEHTRGVPSEEQEAETGGEKVLACRRCLAHITEEAQRISVDGAHQHTFANPHGHVFDIGCFGSAAGCLGAGPVSDEFTWFPGYSWQVVLCRGCMTHLGWRFQSPEGRSFYGLILDCLISSF